MVSGLELTILLSVLFALLIFVVGISFQLGNIVAVLEAIKLELKFPSKRD